MHDWNQLITSKALNTYTHTHATAHTSALAELILTDILGIHKHTKTSLGCIVNDLCMHSSGGSKSIMMLRASGIGMENIRFRKVTSFWQI